MYYPRSGGGINIWEEILSCLDKFSEWIKLDSNELNEAGKKAILELNRALNSLISFCFCSSSEQLSNTDISTLFLITLTMVGVKRKLIRKNNTIRAIIFIHAKLGLKKWK